MNYRGFNNLEFEAAERGDILTPNVLIEGSDSASVDAFGRLRASFPLTLFDSKQIFDKLPLFWDDQEVSGGGTGSTHSAATASTVLSVSANTAGKRVRQTFRRFNYQPGKSNLILETFAGFDTTTGITKGVGFFDDNNGIFFQSTGGILQAVIRSKTSGNVVDTIKPQSEWNIDKLDGTGKSGITLDPSKAQIVAIDFEWLGVGRVRMGFVIDGLVYYVHQFLNANNLSLVYMSTPNLPLRYEIANSGTGAASTFSTICSAVLSEGGLETTGILRSKSTAGVQVDANAADALYAVIGLRLKAAYLGTTVQLSKLSMIQETVADFEWSLWWNPTVAGTFAYSDETNSACQTALGATANTVTNGILIDADFSKGQASVSAALSNALLLGSTISGTPDSIVLCARPLGANADIQATLTWRELL